MNSDPESTQDLHPIPDPVMPTGLFSRPPTELPDYAAPGAAVRDAERFTPNPLRREVADRLALAGRRHNRHILELGALRPGPHAILFFFEQATHAGTEEVVIATRMFLDGADVADLRTVLITLRDRALDYRDARVPRPVTKLVDDETGIHRDSHYVGIGTSSIDSAAHHDPTDWPWRGLAHLDDGTDLIMHGTTTVSRPQLRSTHTLFTHNTHAGLQDNFDPARVWHWAPPNMHDIDRRLAAEQDALTALHHTIIETENESAPRTHRRSSFRTA